MKEEKGSGSDQSRGYWRPLPLGYLLEEYGLFSRKVGLLLGLWIVLFVLSFLSVIYWIPSDWDTLASTSQAISLFLLFYPPLLISNLLLFWLGFEWGFIPAYLSTFMVALAFNMPTQWSILFGIAVVLGMAIFAVVYYSTHFNYTLDSVTHFAFFVGVALVASMASSMGSLIWSHVQELTIEETLIAWQSWWTGTFLQLVFINAPILFLVGDKIERVKDKYFDVPERPDISLGWVYSAIISVVTVLVIFILSAEQLGTLRMEEALKDTSASFANEILSASQTFELTAWIAIVILLAAGLGGIRLVEGWNNTLKDQVRVKRALIAEIHHRVKNNMQLVSGLIELQLQNSESQMVQKELRKSHSRIYSMGKVHEQTYQNEDAADVNMDVYVESIVKQVEANFGEIDGTRFNLVCSSFKLTISQAVTFGLLLNELLTLICRHEYRHANSDTEITISVEGTEKLVKTKFEGISKPFEIAVADSLDGTLIRKLTKQLNTEVHRVQGQEEKESVNLEFTFDKKDSPSYFNSWEPVE
jgi:two-component sensor histidine kinase